MFPQFAAQDEPELDLHVPERYRPSVRIGTCSWKYDSWKGLVYRRGRAYGPMDYLGDYAAILDTVEIDQWFWSLFGDTVSLPDADVVRRYAESVPDRFTFTVKAPNALTLTHTPVRDRSGEGGMPLGDKLGSVMLQFGYLNRGQMPSLTAFIDRLGAFLASVSDGVCLAVEVRNPQFLRPALYDLLSRHGAGLVLTDGYHLPPVRDVFDGVGALPGQFCVLRLLGNDRRGIEVRTKERWDRVVEPRDAALSDIAAILGRIVEQGAEAFVNVNNHYEGSAPRTIGRLIEVLRSRSEGASPALPEV
jgi:uncharacterized protein YecE (DUF72 family)